VPNPVEAVERFVARIAPYDPDPDRPVLSVELRFGDSVGTFALTERATRALYEAIERYTDPDDTGTCPNCGTRVDRDLHCPACHHVGGIFGQTLAHQLNDARHGDGQP
jgi:hypothetical protein